MRSVARPRRRRPASRGCFFFFFFFKKSVRKHLSLSLFLSLFLLLSFSLARVVSLTWACKGDSRDEKNEEGGSTHPVDVEREGPFFFSAVKGGYRVSHSPTKFECVQIALYLPTSPAP